MLNPRTPANIIQLPAGQHAGTDMVAHLLPREVSKKLGRRLRELRSERKYTQLRVAWDCGIDLYQLKEIEEGRRRVSSATLELIAFGMNVRLADLLRES